MPAKSAAMERSKDAVAAVPSPEDASATRAHQDAISAFDGVVTETRQAHAKVSRTKLSQALGSCKRAHRIFRKPQLSTADRVAIPRSLGRSVSR